MTTVNRRIPAISKRVTATLMLMVATALYTAGVAVILARLDELQATIATNSQTLAQIAHPARAGVVLVLVDIALWALVFVRPFQK